MISGLKFNNTSFSHIAKEYGDYGAANKIKKFLRKVGCKCGV